MILARNEFDFVWFAFRGWAKFAVLKTLNYARNGHFIRRAVIKKYLDSHDERKLHLASTEPLAGFLNSQILGSAPIDITTRMPLPDQSFDLVYSSHLVEHIHRAQFSAFLDECHRILKPGGRNIIATPGLESMCKTIYGPNRADGQLLLERSAQYYGEKKQTGAHFFNLEFRDFGHRFLYDTELITAMADAAGYASVNQVENFALPDEAICEYLKSKKPPRWDVLTQTYVLTK
jgi:predicted SAM-dependent methyltransferase